MDRQLYEILAPRPAWRDTILDYVIAAGLMLCGIVIALSTAVLLAVIS